jgi:hypothetical protein
LEDRTLIPWLDAVEDHHLIPLANAVTVGRSSREIREGKDEIARVLNSPINRAYTLTETNRSIGGRPIAQYMADVSENVRASLMFPTEDLEFPPNQAQFMTWAREILGWRFDQLRTQVVTHMTTLGAS